MTTFTGAQAIIQCLQEEGVELVFGYPGGAVLDLYDELMKSPIRHIRVRHEQGAVHAADGYARATGKTGVALLTSGPGATNGVTAIVTVYCDSIPLMILTGQVARQLIGNDAFQEVDIVGITRPCTKQSAGLFPCGCPGSFQIKVVKKEKSQEKSKGLLFMQ